MAMQTNALSKLQMLEAIYRKGDASDMVNRVLDKLIQLERDNARRDVAALKALLASFESRYNMSSGDFHLRFHKGELGDDADFFEWSATCDMHRSALDRFSRLSGASGGVESIGLLENEIDQDPGSGAM